MWCLTIAMSSGVVPYCQQWLLVWFLTISHACWSIATATSILQVECRWKKDGYKFGATCWYRGAIISDMSADPVPLSDIPTCTVQLYHHILTCMLCLFIQIHVFVMQGIWSVTNPSDMPTGRVPLPRVCKTCRLPSWTPS